MAQKRDTLSHPLPLGHRGGCSYQRVIRHQMLNLPKVAKLKPKSAEIGHNHHHHSTADGHL